MDMRQILQALDNASTKPAEGVNDMAKYLQVINEGSAPHKVALPVRMAMETYQPKKLKESKPSLIEKYFTEVQEERLAIRKEKKELLNQYASVIAERVRLKNELLDEGILNPRLIDRIARLMRMPGNATKSPEELERMAAAWEKREAGIKPKQEPIPQEKPVDAKLQQDLQIMSDREFENEYGMAKSAFMGKEGYNPNLSPNAGFKPGAGPGIQSAVAESNLRK